MYQGSDPYYSSEEIVGEGVEVTAGKGASGKIVGNLMWKPIIPGLIKLSVSYQDASGNAQVGTIVDKAKDGTLALVNGDGKAVANVLGTSTINYETGALSVTLAGNNEFVETDVKNVALSYHYNNRSIGDGQIGTNALKVPEVNIRIDTLPVICRSRKLKALYAFDSKLHAA